MQQALLEVYHIPTQRNCFGDPQGVPEGQQDERLVPVTVSAHSTRSGHQQLDFIWRQILPGTEFTVGFTPDFPVCDVWRGVS